MTSSSPPERQLHPVGRLEHQHPVGHHFDAGSVIDLGDGRFKRIEELDSGDFLRSAARGEARRRRGGDDELDVDMSRVVHMEHNHERQTAVLGFAVGDRDTQVR